LQWNVEDPVSQVEINRNTILEGVQGNRNPLLTTLSTTIWGGPQAQNRFDGTIVLDTKYHQYLQTYMLKYNRNWNDISMGSIYKDNVCFRI
jgi:hypothetical protein